MSEEQAKGGKKQAKGGKKQHPQASATQPATANEQDMDAEEPNVGSAEVSASTATTDAEEQSNTAKVAAEAEVKVEEQPKAKPAHPKVEAATEQDVRLVDVTPAKTQAQPAVTQVSSTIAQPPAKAGGSHAIVIGGSMAGMLAGRVLADYFDRITIIEKDHYPDKPSSRKSVPQALHLHNMVNQGWEILEKLFPDLGGELVEHGATVIEWPADLLWLGRTGWSPRFYAGIQTYSCQRHLMEWCIQRRMAGSKRVQFIEGCKVTDVVWNESRTAIVGVKYTGADQESGDETVIHGDIVVDASGRMSQTPKWFQENGFGVPREEIIKAHVGYSTRYYTVPEERLPDWKVLLEQSRPPHLNRAAGLFRVDGGQWVLTLVGMGNDNHPPTEESGFMEFMQSLPSPVLYNFIKEAQPVSPIYGYKVPKNRLFHYEELSRWPERFMLLGDAVCLFNPVYGHGISVVAQSVMAMDKCLREQRKRRPDGNLSGLGKRFQQSLAKVLTIPWMFTAGEDLRYPTTEGGNRDLFTQMMHWYIDGVMMYALENPSAHRTLIQVMHLIEEPSVFLRPDIMINAVALNVEQFAMNV